jgi:hypothetical protein
MKAENFEKLKRENKRQDRYSKNTKSELFDFEKLKLSVRKWFIRLIWIFIVATTIFGLFKIVKWGKVFNQNYVEYVNKKEDSFLPTLIGEKKLNSEDIKNIQEFENRLNKIKIKINSIETSTSTNTFIYNVTNLNKNINNNFAIKISFDKKIDDTWNTFVSVFFSKDIKESEKENLEYIDIRYSSKVFYKLKNTNTENKAANTEEIL